MFALLQTFWSVALRRLGPEDLPDSKFLLGVILMVYVCVQAPLIWILYNSSLVILQTILAQLTMMSACVWGMLMLAGHRTRFRQTMIALIGTSALLSALTVPFVVWHQSILAADSELRLPAVAILMILIWSLAVDGHIFSRALSRPFVIGLMIAVCYYIVSSSFMTEILPTLSE